MPGTPTTKYGIPTLSGADFISDIDTHVNNSLASIDSKMVGYSEGVLASRPTSTPGSPGIAGRIYRATDTGTVFMDTGTGWVELNPAGFTAGDLKPTAVAVAPTGWLLCDGAVVSRTTFAVLFAAIGTAYGAGDGSTTFGLPNLKGRVPVGRDAAQTEFDTLGESGGAKTHTLTIAEMPSHGHTTTATIVATVNAGSQVNVHGVGADGTGATGGGGAHQNMPPFQVVNYLIKT